MWWNNHFGEVFADSERVCNSVCIPCKQYPHSCGQPQWLRCRSGKVAGAARYCQCLSTVQLWRLMHRAPSAMLMLRK
jgi:hypothetical protein